MIGIYYCVAFGGDIRVYGDLYCLTFEERLEIETQTKPLLLSPYSRSLYYLPIKYPYYKIFPTLEF